MKKSSIISFQSNRHYLKWFWFVVETLVSAFVGALIAFVFGGHIWAAILAFGILMSFLILLCFVLVLFENKVSVLSIMNQGLADGKYEDVIKFGSAMSPTLFTSNKNEDRIILGEKIDEAAAKIQTDHYNKSQGDYLVTIDGCDKTINLIRIGLKIDDLGWSLHLCKQDDQAITNISMGIKEARKEALRLKNKYSDETDERANAVLPYVRLIMRGYRHLCGIFYEDVSKHEYAIFYEQVTRMIMSNYSIISLGGVCEHRIPSPCGLYCLKDIAGKNDCIRNNIKELYFNFENQENVSVDDNAIIDFLGFNNTQMSLPHIREDVELFNCLHSKDKEKIIKEQCYAWGRNMVKRLQRRMMQSCNKFISDAELVCKISEAKSFAQLYYYGAKDVPKNDSAEIIIDKPLIGKSELRYLSLLNEISLIELFVTKNESESYNIEKLISNLKRTVDLCRDKRADLYVRNSLLLMKAYYLEYDWSNRFSDGNTPIKIQKNKAILKTKIKQVKELYKRIIKYEHRRDIEVYSVYKDTLNKFRICKKELKLHYKKVAIDNNDIIVNGFNELTSNSFRMHFRLQNINSKTFEPSTTEIAKIINKWSLE